MIYPTSNTFYKQVDLIAPRDEFAQWLTLCVKIDQRRCLKWIGTVREIDFPDISLEVDAKWPPFSRRHLHWWKCMNFDENLIEVCSCGPNYQYPSIGSDNGQAPTRDKPLSEPMVVRLPTHVCVTRPEWTRRFYNGPYSDRQEFDIHCNLWLHSGNIACLACE